MDYLFYPKSSSLKDILTAFCKTCKNYYIKSEQYQRFGYLIGLLLIFIGLFHIIPLAFDSFDWSGAVSFRKPIVFGLALGLNALSFAWVMTYLPKLKKTSWAILILYTIVSFLEIIPITIQVWRGLPSHFNELDPLSNFLWSVMGTSVIGLVIVVIAMTFWGLFWLKAPSNFSAAIKIGLCILLIGQGLGGWIISNANTVIGDNPQETLAQERTFEAASTYKESGNMKLPHFISLHAIQFLIVLAILTQYTNWKEKKKKQILLTSTIGIIGLLAVVLYQVFNGLTLFDINFLSGTLLAIMFALTVVPIGITYAGIRKKFQRLQSK